MAEIKRVNIYMGVVGQAYVDKETALKDLNAAIKNVHDMEEIIQAATEQQPIAQTVYENAVAAQQLAQSAYNQLSQKFDSASETDTLYNQLLDIVKDLNVNDNDNNPYNGGSTITAQENVNEIQAQIAELAAIIAEGNESLQRRIAFVDELQGIYDNALEVFKSYLPEEEGYDWNAWDEEEKLLWDRINAVINKLALANEITEAINNTSKDVIKNAVDVILSVSNSNSEKLANIQTSIYNYINIFNVLSNQFNALRVRFNDIGTGEADVQIQNIDGDLSIINNYLLQLNTDIYPRMNNLINTNTQIISTWENIKNSIDASFNINDFDTSVNDIYYINETIKNNTDLLNELKNYEISFNRKITNYQTTLSLLEEQNTYPDTISFNGIIYYKNEPESPGENYILETIDHNGHMYYRWVEQEQEQYWYVGNTSTPPTENDYTLLTQVNENDNPYTHVNTSEYNYMYIILRNEKSIASIKDTNNFDILYQEYTDVTIPGYKVYRSNQPIALDTPCIITLA